MLDIDRNQVTNEHRPIHLFLGNMPLTCIHENRHRHRDALISGAGIDHNRERTSTHTCIRTCRCRCTGFSTDIIPPVFEDGLTDLCAPCVVESLLGNLRVHLDLALNHVLNFSEIYSVCILKKSLKAHLVSICEYGFFCALLHNSILYVAKNLLILLHIDDIRMVVCDAYTGCMLF